MGTTVTQQCHHTAEGTLGDEAQPDASITPWLTGDAARQRDASSDTQVPKIGLSKRKPGFFTRRDFSLPLPEPRAQHAPF